MDFFDEVTFDDIHIQIVKNTAPASHPSITYGKALEAFFSSPQWNHLKTTSGRDVVEFLGEFVYQGTPTNIRLLLVFADDGRSFGIGAIFLGGEKQDISVAHALIGQAFEAYTKGTISDDIFETSMSSPSAMPFSGDSSSMQNPFASGQGMGQTPYASVSSNTQSPFSQQPSTTSTKKGFPFGARKNEFGYSNAPSAHSSIDFMMWFKLIGGAIISILATAVLLFSTVLKSDSTVVYEYGWIFALLVLVSGIVSIITRESESVIASVISIVILSVAVILSSTFETYDYNPFFLYTLPCIAMIVVHVVSANMYHGVVRRVAVSVVVVAVVLGVFTFVPLSDTKARTATAEKEVKSTIVVGETERTTERATTNTTGNTTEEDTTTAHVETTAKNSSSSDDRTLIDTTLIPMMIFDPLVYTGSGDDIVELEIPEDAVWVLYVKGNAADRHFSVTGYDDDGNYCELFVNTTTPYEGISVDMSQDSTVLEVNAEPGDPWTIEVRSIFSCDYIIDTDMPYNGSGSTVLIVGERVDDTSFYFGTTSKRAYIEGNSSEDYFGIHSYGLDSNYGDLLVNTTDAYTGTVMLKKRPAILQIESKSNWSITLK